MFGALKPERADPAGAAATAAAATAATAPAAPTAADTATTDTATWREQDRPNIRIIVIAVIALLTIVTILVVGIVQLFTWSLRAEIRRKQLEPVSSLLRDVRAEEQAKLNRLQWIDEAAGVVRIPLERARQLVLSDYAAADQRPAGDRAPAGERSR